MVVEAPYEIYDVPSGTTLELDILNYAMGSQVEMTRKDGTMFTQAPLRLYLAEPYEAGRMSYLDITGKRLQAALLPELQTGKYKDFILRLSKVGEAPRALFPFEWVARGS